MNEELMAIALLGLTHVTAERAGIEIRDVTFRAWHEKPCPYCNVRWHNQKTGKWQGVTMSVDSIAEMTAAKIAHHIESIGGYMKSDVGSDVPYS